MVKEPESGDDLTDANIEITLVIAENKLLIGEIRQMQKMLKGSHNKQ